MPPLRASQSDRRVVVPGMWSAVMAAVGPNGPQVVLREPEGPFGRLAQRAFYDSTDDVSWIEDPGEAYLLFMAGFLAAMQIVATRPTAPETVEAMAEALTWYHETNAT